MRFALQLLVVLLLSLALANLSLAILRVAAHPAAVTSGETLFRFLAAGVSFGLAAASAWLAHRFARASRHQAS